MAPEKWCLIFASNSLFQDTRTWKPQWVQSGLQFTPETEQRHRSLPFLRAIPIILCFAFYGFRSWDQLKSTMSSLQRQAAYHQTVSHMGLSYLVTAQEKSLTLWLKAWKNVHTWSTGGADHPWSNETLSLLVSYYFNLSAKKFKPIVQFFFQITWKKYLTLDNL